VPEPFVAVPFAKSETKKKDRVGTLLILPGPIVLIGLVPLAGAEAGLSASILTAIASIVFALLRRARVLMPRHEAAERHRFGVHTYNEEQRAAQHTQWVTQEYARHAQLVAKFHAAEQARKASFDRTERSNASNFEANEALRLVTLEACRAGEAVALVALLCAAVPIDMEAEYPEGFEGAAIDDHGVGFIVERNAVRLFLRAPELSIVPTKSLEMSADDTKQKTTKLAEKDRSAIYKTFVCSFSLAYAEALYEACPSLTSILVETFVPAIDPGTGETVENVLLSAEYRRDVIGRLNLSKVDPEALLETIHARVREPSKRAKPTALSATRDQITWVTDGERPVDIAFGLVPGQDEWEAPNKFAVVAPAEGPLPLP
jgi:hypothetical protein